MTIVDAQRDMRAAYYGGAPGLVASGVIWLLAGSLAAAINPKSGVIALCLGGAVIHPLAQLLCKMLGRSGRHQADNPLASLALESTGVLLLCLLLAVAISFYRIELFFPAMLIVIGARYLTFQTIYGLRVYWICGAILALAGLALASANLWLPTVAFITALIEWSFALVIFLQSRHENSLQ